MGCCMRWCSGSGLRAAQRPRKRRRLPLTSSTSTAPPRRAPPLNQRAPSSPAILSPLAQSQRPPEAPSPCSCSPLAPPRVRWLAQGICASAAARPRPLARRRAGQLDGMRQSAPWGVAAARRHGRGRGAARRWRALPLLPLLLCQRCSPDPGLAPYTPLLHSCAPRGGGPPHLGARVRRQAAQGPHHGEEQPGGARR